MPVIPLKCPACGGDMQIDSDESLMTCQYCGKTSIVKDAIVHNYIQNVVNIKAETVNIYQQQKEFEIEGGVLKKYSGESCDVVIPDNVVALGEGAFEGLAIRSVVIPKDVTELRDNCFKGCSSLTSIKLPDNVTLLGNACFYGCTSLTSINIPDKITSFGDSCFYNCALLALVNIPEKITSLGSNCFYGCSSLTSITIPAGIKSIGEHCCDNCSSLTSINIPNGETDIEFIREERRKRGLCPYCGGTFHGFLTTKCSKCERPKDYFTA